MKKSSLVVIGVAVLAAGAASAVYFSRSKSAEPRYRKGKLDRGDVVATVTATGTLSAVTTVKVGSQVSGIIAKLYVDFNAPVKKHQILAELDPTPFQQAVEQSRANLDKAKVQLRNDEIGLTRAKKLFAEQLIAQSDLDGAQTTRDSDIATVAQVTAQLKQNETNLSYTKILSPIDGVVVDRQYDVGQTVAASFQAPVIFTIAQDLTKMQVLTNIDEADVGRIRVGQEASFSVDAFPDGAFKGAVSQVRLSPQTVQNVVTYPVMLDVPNEDLKLKPGMTANVQVPVEVRKNALRAPNAALRFRPDPSDIVATVKPSGGPPATASGAPASTGSGAERPQSVGGGRRDGGPGGGRGAGGSGGGGSRPGGPAGMNGTGSPRAGGRTATLYVEVPGTNGKMKAVSVKTLITDGNVTAIESSELKEGDEIVVSLTTARAGGPGGPVGAGGPGGGMGRRM